MGFFNTAIFKTKDLMKVDGKQHILQFELKDKGKASSSSIADFDMYAMYEVDKILNDMGMSRLEVNTDLKEGTLVKVISGPFSGMEGKVDSVDKDNNKLIVLLDLFGQETSVEVEFSQIEKINA